MLTLTGHTTTITALAYSPEGGMFASADRDGSVRLWDLGGEGTLITEEGGPIGALAFSPDGRRLVVGGADKRLSVWEPQTGRSFGAFGPLQPAGITGLAFLPDRRTLAVASGERGYPERSGGLQLLDLQSAGTRSRFFEAGGVWSLTTLPERRAVAWATGMRRLVSWDVTTPQPRPLPSTKKPASALAASPDGRTLAVAVDWTVSVCDAQSGSARATLTGHKGLVTAIAFSPDGRFLASAGRDEMVRMWDVVTWHEAMAYHWPIGRLTAVAFAPDGTTMVAASDNGGLIVWDRDDF